MSGKVSLLVTQEDGKVVHHLFHKYKGETKAACQAIMTKAAATLLEGAKSPLFGDDFNVGADLKVGTLTADYEWESQFDDGEPADYVRWVKSDLDTVEIAMLTKAFETLR
jgi:hypothetical protein